MIKTSRFDNYFDHIAILSLAVYLFCMQMRESAFFDITLISYIIKFLIRLTFLAIILKNVYDFFRGKFSVKEIIIYLVFGIYFLIIYLRFRQANFLLILLYISALKNVSYEKTIKWSFYAMVICFFIIVISSFTGYLNEYTKVEIRHGVSMIRRHLGYYFSCALNYFMSITFMYLLYKRKLSVFDNIAIFIISSFVYAYTDTRSSYACIILLLTLNIVFHKIKKGIILKSFAYLTIFSFPLGTLFAFILTYLYRIGNSFALHLNVFITGRLKLMSNAFDRWKITLFGQNIYDSNSEYTYLDSSYLNIFFNFGIITLLIVVIFYMLYTYLVYKKKNIELLIVLFIASIHSIFDPQLIILFYSPFIVLFIHHITWRDTKT